MKFNRSIIICLIIMIFITFTGCGQDKVALSPEKFIETMKDKKFEIVDATDQYEEGTFKKCILAMTENYQIEYYQTNDTNDAISAYQVNRDSFKEQIEDNSSETEKILGNYSKFTMADNSNYYVLSRIEDTFIYIVAPLEYKSEINDILNDLNY